MSSTSAVEVSIHEVSPVLIWSALTRYGAVGTAASPLCANACEANAASAAPKLAIFPLMPCILANGSAWDVAPGTTNWRTECARCLTKCNLQERAPAWRVADQYRTATRE